MQDHDGTPGTKHDQLYVRYRPMRWVQPLQLAEVDQRLRSMGETRDQNMEK
jgi:hypothetical protein